MGERQRFTLVFVASNIQHHMYRYRWVHDRKDIIVKMFSKRASDQIRILVSEKSLDRSAPVTPNIRVLPEHWKILWSDRVAGLPQMFGEYVSIVEYFYHY